MSSAKLHKSKFCIDRYKNNQRQPTIQAPHTPDQPHLHSFFYSSVWIYSSWLHKPGTNPLSSKLIFPLVSISLQVMPHCAPQTILEKQNELKKNISGILGMSFCSSNSLLKLKWRPSYSLECCSRYYCVVSLVLLQIGCFKQIATKHITLLLLAMRKVANFWLIS